MRAIEVYQGSDGEVTKKYYAALSERGPIGVIAMNLFRAQKSSSRAKAYRGGIPGQGSYRRMAYERKAWSMSLLCDVLAKEGAALNIAWGWGPDGRTLFSQKVSWVLYVDLPQGQVSFHSPDRGEGPKYWSDWDGERKSEERILVFCDAVMDGTWSDHKMFRSLAAARAAIPVEQSSLFGEVKR